MALLYPTSTNAVQKTLDAQLLAGATTSVTLNNVVGIQNKAGVFVVDRVDANGTATPSKREYIKFTGVSGSTLTGLTRNADGGGSDQDHAVGAIVEFVSDVLQEQAILDGLLLTVTTAGVLNKADGTDINTGTDDAKIVTAKAITDSNVPNEIIIPATIIVNDGSSNLTTSSTDELTVISKTITNPSVAGRILATAELNVASSTVTGDVFTYRLYFGTSPTQITAITQTTLSNGRSVVHLSGTAAVANSGTQILKITIQRTGGTGTITALNGNCSLSWIIVSGATSTA